MHPGSAVPESERRNEQACVPSECGRWCARERQEKPSG